MNSTIVLELLPENLRGKNGPVKFDANEAPFFGLYFSAHWCGPCNSFTPKLINFYKTANKEKKQIEIIFISSDRTEPDFNGYYETMPWISMPFGDEAIKTIKETFDIRGIPTFLVFNKEGKLIDDSGRTTVENRYPKNGYTEETVKTIIDIWSTK